MIRGRSILARCSPSSSAETQKTRLGSDDKRSTLEGGRGVVEGVGARAEDDGQVLRCQAAIAALSGTLRRQINDLLVQALWCRRTGEWKNGTASSALGQEACVPL